jgi:hypothetical protein
LLDDDPFGRELFVSTDFRSGSSFPRRGRESTEGFLWLARLFDKARAARDQTIFDYIYPCPMDRGVMDRWGITERVFDAAIEDMHTDEEIVTWLKARVPDKNRDEANRWLIEEKIGNLEKQDEEEGVVPA